MFFVIPYFTLHMFMLNRNQKCYLIAQIGSISYKEQFTTNFFDELKSL